MEGQSSKFLWMQVACYHAHCILHNHAYFVGLI